ncbi:MAG: aromatic-ring-hydroxylating dioxygenase subunit beta [Thermostichus sp. DG02_5_bins_236]
MSSLQLPPDQGLEGVKALYDELATERDWVLAAPLATDKVLVAAVAQFLALEARMLDAGRFEAWLDLWDPDGWYWIPLRRDSHPGQDQALFLDDRRRLQERVWRMRDLYAWGIQPLPEIVRGITTVEAWKQVDETVLSSSTLTLHIHSGSGARLVATRQIHRLRPQSSGFQIFRKTVLIPELAQGSRHLGWFL